MTEFLPAALAFTFMLYALWHFDRHRVQCLQCGGTNKHRKGCPFGKDDDG